MRTYFHFKNRGTNQCSKVSYHTSAQSSFSLRCTTHQPRFPPCSTESPEHAPFGLQTLPPGKHGHWTASTEKPPEIYNIVTTYIPSHHFTTLKISKLICIGYFNLKIKRANSLTSDSFCPAHPHLLADSKLVFRSTFANGTYHCKCQFISVAGDPLLMRGLIHQ